MRSGAAGSTRIASSPAMRLNWRRRRANSLPSIPVSGFIPVLGPSMQLLAMPRTERAVAMQQQRRDAHELLDLGQRAFILFVAVVLRNRGREPGKVRQRLPALVGQRGFRARG